MSQSQLTEIQALNLFEHPVIVRAQYQTLLAAIDFQDDFSTEATKIVRQILTLLHNIENKHDEAFRSAYSWCVIANPLMKAFLDAKDNESRESIIQHLVGGKEGFSEVITRFGECGKYIADVFGHLNNLRSQLKKDFDEKSNFYKALMKNCQNSTYGASILGASTALTLAASGSTGGGATANSHYGFVGLICLCGLAAFFLCENAVHNTIKPELNNRLADIKAQFNDVKNKMGNNLQLITSLGDILKKEIHLANNIKNGQVVVNALLNLPKLPEPTLTIEANKLIDSCQQFIDRHAQYYA